MYGLDRRATVCSEQNGGRMWWCGIFVAGVSLRGRGCRA